ncbi:hypothetical protein PEC302107_28540 [Pectobacterium araliae]|uniref:Uncharacterized protein n=1 Tax=Pectobacterium araliae TaxID=3073862 RepID=A0AAN0KP10_9GAMM|nr:hypothetical protein PEC302110_36060 [Pectobacterium sp. MAFF 302110]GKW21125.1 hypothetical protein PEC302107_28540 [Pectobacterium carotovorum subsp. carotovorum]
MQNASHLSMDLEETRCEVSVGMPHTVVAPVSRSLNDRHYTDVAIIQKSPVAGNVHYETKQKTSDLAAPPDAQTLSRSTYTSGERRRHAV